MDKLIFFTTAILVSTSAHSYLGPGMGGGIIAAVIGIFAAIFIALFGILYYPVKRMIKKRKK